MKIKRIYFLIILIFLIGNISILLNIGDFIYLGGSKYSDIPITHYPNLLFIQDSLINHKQIPLWSDLIFSGYPFSSNPLSGLWYFPGWIALIFPLPLGINISLLIHLFIGMFGMFFFLKQMNLSDKSALFGAIAFTFSSKIFAHIGAGHLSLIYAICWTPWFLRYLFITFDKKLKYSWLFPGMFLGIILLADLRWSIPLSFIWITLFFLSNSSFAERIKRSFLVLLSGLLLSIAVWLPLLELIPLSNRSELSVGDRMIFSMNLSDFLNLFFPMQEGSAELRVYPAATVILLVVLGFRLIKDDRRIRFWYLLALVSTIFSFGENLPGINILFNLPGFSLTRVPARFIFSFVFALIMISTQVLEKLISQKDFSLRSKPYLGVFGVFIFVIIFSVGGIIISGEIYFHFLWPIIIFSLSFFCLIQCLKNSKKSTIYHYGFILFLFIDLVVINSKSLTFENSNVALNKDKEVLELIQSDETIFRIYTLSYSISQEKGAFWNIRQVNGIDPIQLSEYVNFFENASGVSVNQYSVTLPPFKNSNPILDNSEFCPDENMLKELNTRYIISSYSLSECFTHIPEKVSKNFVYQISSSGNYLKFLNCNNSTLEYTIQKYSPNQVEFLVNSCGGYLQISEIYYPGWKIFIDNQPASFESDVLFRKVYVPKGEHLIKMLYRPIISIGSAIGQFSLWILVIGFIWIVNWKQNEKDLV